ncbi:MAG: rane protein [Flaviaesturariibacter sp.]|nr:rane protein [Flaviaesturariibacter sp.]
MQTNILLAVLLLLGMYGSARTRKLTTAGAIGAGVIGVAVYAGTGWLGILLLCIFFLLGTLATSWRRELKEKAGVGEKRSGRNLGQVFANGGLAGILGGLAYFFPQWKDLFTLMLAAGLSSATADTMSSELGTIYGKRFYNILTGRRDQKGLDGVISAEGTAIGFIGSCLIASIHFFAYRNFVEAVIIILTGTTGNLLDSVLGASLERQHRLGNNAVNFLNTLLAVFLAWLLY